MKGGIVECYNYLVSSNTLSVDLYDSIGKLQYCFFDSSRVYLDFFSIFIFFLVSLFLSIILLSAFFFCPTKP